MGNEVKDFDFRQCPYCGETLDIKTDLDPGWHSCRRHVFKCHACEVVYEVTPVVLLYQARKIAGEEPLSQEADRFLEEREKRIEKARWKASES